ncbi:16013_t:CDS:10 [Acaulospora morrowiae]|uniref:16013_t:CDS:1 n=1 Tax=Acaulospora morrowiae TaxID=94023 RepID=A0A9N8Z4H7_9GLOM|nr:16013_t:CDS:10 [Acaulospora morrowiae]
MSKRKCVRKSSKLSGQVEEGEKVGSLGGGSIIDGIIDICMHDGEEYALVTYLDKNFDPKWHPIRNLINADHLVNEYRQIERNASQRAAQRLSNQGEETAEASQRVQSQTNSTCVPSQGLTEEPNDQISQSRRSPSVDSSNNSMDDPWSQNSKSQKSSPESPAKRSKDNTKKKVIKRTSSTRGENSKNVVVTKNIGKSKKKKYRGKVQQIVFIESGSEESDAKVDYASAHEDDMEFDKPTNVKEDSKSTNDNEQKKSNNFFDELSNSDYDAWELPDDSPSPSPVEKSPKRKKSSSIATVDIAEKKMKNVKSEEISIFPEPVEVPMSVSSSSSSIIKKSTPLKTKSKKTSGNVMPDITPNIKLHDNDNYFWMGQYSKQQEVESRNKITKTSNLLHDLLERPEQSRSENSNLSHYYSGQTAEQMEMDFYSKQQSTNKNLRIPFENQEDSVQSKIQKAEKEYISMNNPLEKIHGSKNSIEENMHNTSRASFSSQNVRDEYAQKKQKLMHKSTAEINIPPSFTLDVPVKREEEDLPNLHSITQNSLSSSRSSFIVSNQREEQKYSERIPLNQDVPALLTNTTRDNDLNQFKQSSQKMTGASVLTENTSRAKKGVIKKPTNRSLTQVEPLEQYHLISNGPTQWVGSLIKGDLVQFGGKVTVKPMEGRCKNSSTLEMIKHNTELWMENMLPQAYAEKLVVANDPEKYPMFTMNAVENNPTSKKNVEEENTLMKWNEIVGVIWLDKAEKLCWLVFPNSQRTCVTLAISPRPSEKFIIIPRRICVDDISDSSLINLSETDPLSDSRLLSNESYHMVQLVILSNNYTALPDICSNASNFAVFGPKDNFEVEEMVDACKGLNVNYDHDFSGDNIDLVLIHIQYFNQINYIPRLIELKHNPGCKFRLFGWNIVSADPVNLVECFPNGCVVTITPKLLLSWARDVIQRIRNITNQQRTENGGEWYIKVHPLLKSYLEYTFNKDQSREAEEALHYLNKHFQLGNFSYFNEEELYLLQGSLENDSPFINKLHYMMTRYHNLNVRNLRHVIVIQDESEVGIFCLPIEGVERMTLPEFQSKFGPSK